MYNFLKIQGWENILNQIEIMDSILSGKKNDIAKLINIKSKGYFDRVYGVYVALKQTNSYDISMRVAKAIEHRYKELQQGIIKTQIELVDSFNNEDSKDKEIAEKDELLKQKDQEVSELKEQVAYLTKLMEEQIKSQNKDKADADTKPAPKRGRPASNK